MEIPSADEYTETADLFENVVERGWLMGTFNNVSISYEADAPDGMYERLFITGIKVDRVYTPILTIVGLFGNSLSVYVLLCDPKHRNKSSSYYLSALAISDAGFLLNLLTVWLDSVFGGFLTHPFTCPIVMYIGQVTCFVSVYLTVAFTLERYIAINFPFARPRLCTTSKARKIIFGLVSTAFVLFSYACWIAQVVEFPYQSGNLNGSTSTSTEESNRQPTFVCTVPEEYFRISEIASYFDSAVTLIIPFILIFCLNLGIAFSVKGISRKRNDLVTTSYSGAEQKPHRSRKPITEGNSGRTDDDIMAQVNDNSLESVEYDDASVSSRKPADRKRIRTRKRKDSRSEVRVTKMLLLVSSVFLALNVPLHAIRCVQFYQLATRTAPEPNQRDFFQAMQPWANMLFNTSFSVNFLLYCVAGTKFRKSLYDLVIKRKSAGKVDRARGPTTCRMKCESILSQKGIPQE